MLVSLDRSFSWNSVCSLISIAAFASAIAVSSKSPRARAQSAPRPTSPPSQPSPEWQIAAGSHMSFEVASIRPGDPSKFTPPTIGMNIDDTLIPPGGYFNADFPLPVYIEFAYKFMFTSEQRQAMLAGLPKWVDTQPFVIEARAEGNPTKDQMRLMMQSLLADRFRLAVHFETSEQQALALVLVKPGALGPRIRQHTFGLACDARWTAPTDRTAPTVPPGGFLPTCGAVQVIDGMNHTVMLGARDVPLQSIAAYLAEIPPVMDFGRPVVDQTGLVGMYDFSLYWLPDRSRNSPGASQPSDAQGPSFEDALKDQLGFKLRPMRTAVQILVIDHVEQPSPN